MFPQIPLPPLFFPKFGRRRVGGGYLNCYPLIFKNALEVKKVKHQPSAPPPANSFIIFLKFQEIVLSILPNIT